MVDGYQRLLMELVEGELRRQRAVIEQACEAAVQGGLHGVRVVYDGAALVSAAVDPEVPYGYVAEEQTWGDQSWVRR